MEYAFRYQLNENGSTFARPSGTAVIEELHNSGGQWGIASIWLDDIDDGSSAIVTDPWLYARIALWLLNARRADIDAAWRAHKAKEAA